MNLIENLQKNVKKIENFCFKFHYNAILFKFIFSEQSIVRVESITSMYFFSFANNNLTFLKFSIKGKYNIHTFF